MASVVDFMEDAKPIMAKKYNVALQETKRNNLCHIMEL